MRTPAHTSLLRTTTAALALATGLAALTGCSSADDQAGGDSAGTAVESRPAEGGAAEPGPAEPGTADAPQDSGAMGSAEKAAAVVPAALDRKLARRADIALTVVDVDAAAAKVRTIAAAARGFVLSESVSSEPDSPDLGGFSTVTISVPADALDPTLDRLAELGEVHSRNTSTEDVTAQYVDTESRVKTMQASVDRVRALMGEATRLADIVSLEAELSRRQADLEAMQAQLAALEDAVQLAPIEVSLSTDESALESREDDTGFLAGLAAGWTAFTTSVRVLLTALGAVLPFAVAAALVVVPLVVWLRRRASRPGATPQPGVPTPPAA
jgi:hypothetical protein